MKTLFLESVAGIAGDMFAASFIDAGLVDSEAAKRVPRQLGLRDVEVVISSRTKASMHATHVDVEVGDNASQHLWTTSSHAHEGGTPHHHHHATIKAIDRLLADSELPGDAKDFARAVFALLAEAEARAHGIPPEEVHFHEIGATDSIIDVALAGLCVTTVAPDRVMATPVKLGRGTIQIQHGTHTVPPPASARLAEGFPIAAVPAAIEKTDVELSTPTGLAILKALSPTFVEAWPEGVLLAQGTGCGTMDLGTYPNTFRVALFETNTPAGNSGPASVYDSDTVVEICCNIDDDSGERIAWIADELRALGALDVWLTNVHGKKGRPAVMLSMLVPIDGWSTQADWLLRHSSTFGLRYRTWERLKLRPHREVRDVGGRQVPFKVGRTRTGEPIKAKPEFEELRRVWSDDPDFKA